MRKSFHVPSFYKSLGLVELKRTRRDSDPKRKNLSPTVVDFGPVRFKIARHFGFCFGVENAIDIAYRAVEESHGRRIFLLSEMIHNPEVNADLESRGVRFLMRPDGTRLVDFAELRPDDVVIVPAFGTTIELQKELVALGIDPYFYDTTCPFVQKVWKRAEELGKSGYTVIVHGKRTHEETRATFSHSRENSPTLVILNLEEAHTVKDFILGTMSSDEFRARFEGCCSDGFDPENHLVRVGVVNQTTMLATETQAIADVIREAMVERYGADELSKHYADTRDTLCYATYENQGATKALIAAGADIAIVVGGYNSSNTSHLVELAAEKVPTYYIKNAGEIVSRNEIRHYDLHRHDVVSSKGWLPEKASGPIDVAITSGASCPDRIVEEVIEKVLSFYGVAEGLSPEVVSAATALH
ncbi:MAG: 4-hydroxy-3-methylbut-2-enyl diphosphate reductase [Bdellovibrionota bacterium]